MLPLMEPFNPRETDPVIASIPAAVIPDTTVAREVASIPTTVIPPNTCDTRHDYKSVTNGSGC